MTDESALEQRLQRFEDRYDIEQLRYRYCYAIDTRDWDALVSLFTDDATLDYGGLGTFEGKEGVREFATAVVEENLAATAHAVHNPILTVEENSATGQWYVSSPVTFADGTGGFRWGRYDEQYRRVDGAWRIEDLRLRILYSIDFEGDGWPNWTTYTPDEYLQE